MRTENYIAIDGCKGGWIAVIIDPKKRLTIEIIDKGGLRTFISKYKSSSPILIDMPIGLLEKGNTMRYCDYLARKMLGKGKTSSVFSVPTREALDKKTHEAASKTNLKAAGRKISIQSWNLKEKLVEVDDLIASNRKLRDILIEFHPELTFAYLNDSTPIYNKKKRRNGRDERISILHNSLPGLNIKAFYQVHKQPGTFAEDDFLDALAGAVMLMKCKGKLKFLPDKEECSDFQFVTKAGVKMRIAYI